MGEQAHSVTDTGRRLKLTTLPGDMGGLGDMNSKDVKLARHDPAEAFDSQRLSWTGAIVHAFSPFRWGICLIGLLTSMLLVTLFLRLFTGQLFGVGDWWLDPRRPLNLLGIELLDGSFGTGLLRSVLLATGLMLIWSLIGAWIARAELLRQCETNPPIQTSATRLVLGKLWSLWAPFVMVLLLVCVALVPGLIAGLFVRFGITAIVVSVVLPILYVFSLLAVILVVPGAFAYWLTPATIAAEGSDSFDAISRSYAYVCQRPLQFLWWWGWSLAASSIPLLLVGLWQREHDNVLSLAWFLVAGLSLSIFLSLQCLVYVKLRRSVDDVAETELWDAPLAKRSSSQDQQQDTKSDALKLTTENWSRDVHQANEPVIISFGASWCSHSQKQLENLKEFTDTYHGRIKVCQVDVDQEPELAARFQITSIPRTLVFREGDAPHQEMIGLVADQKLRDLFSNVSDDKKEDRHREKRDSRRNYRSILTSYQSQGSRHTEHAKLQRTSFRDTLSSDWTVGQSRHLGLALIWVVLPLAAAAWVVSQISGAPAGASLREAAIHLATNRPAIFVGISIVVQLVGALGLRNVLRAAARNIAISRVFGITLDSATVLSFARSVGWRGMGSVLLMTIGVTLMLIAGLLAVLVWQNGGPWAEPLLFLGLAVVLLGFGSCGLAGVAVEGKHNTQSRSGLFLLCVSNAGATLGSAMINLFTGSVRFIVLTVIACLAWFVMCESLSWWGGGRDGWVRWGLDGQFWPQVDGVLFGIASVVAGIWFFLIVGYLLTYPISYSLRWGVSVFLLARQEIDGILPDDFELAENERKEVETNEAKTSGATSAWPGEGSFKVSVIYNMCERLRHCPDDQRQVQRAQAAAFLSEVDPSQPFPLRMILERLALDPSDQDDPDEAVLGSDVKHDLRVLLAFDSLSDGE